MSAITFGLGLVMGFAFGALWGTVVMILRIQRHGWTAVSAREILAVNRDVPRAMLRLWRLARSRTPDV